MSDTAIRVENLGKRYQLGATKSGSFRESLTRAFRRPDAAIPDSGFRSSDSAFWALQDINFEIKRGEAVGIIGRNGAGKSTLLKILSRITEPTRGRFEIFGRVSSLLEVGTGFHPELTGRENVYLNGTILGMKRREVKAKFDEIVAFSGVEKFIDTPVKHYSSGMQVRLAFAVAAHLEPEILIIDEVLAVGDAEFQKKCLGKMEDVTGEGRTVLFVSHNMGAVKRLCRRGILLQKSNAAYDGNVQDAIEKYIFDSPLLSSKELTENKSSSGDGKANFERIVLTRSNGSETSSFMINENIQIHLNVATRFPLESLSVNVRITDGFGNSIAAWRTRDTYHKLVPMFCEKGTITLNILGLNLLEGFYFVHLGLASSAGVHDVVENAICLEIISSSAKTEKVHFRGDTMIFTPCEWEFSLN